MTSPAGFSNGIVYANNVCFDGTRTEEILLDGQLIIGSNSPPHVRVNTLTSTGHTITITNGHGTINLEAGGTVPTTFETDTGNAVPILNVLKVLGGFGVKTSGATNIVTVTHFEAWIDTSGAVPILARNYIATATSTLTLPAAPIQGDTVKVYCDTTNVITIQAAAGQSISVCDSISAPAGKIVSTSLGDSVTLVYRTTGLRWFAHSFVGAWTVS